MADITILSSQIFPSCQSVADRVRDSILAGRPPVLVYGSGMLREVNFGPFCDWSVLLHEVAHQMRVPFDEELARGYPTLYWEAMLAAAARKNQVAAYIGERNALRIVAGIIERASSQVDCPRFQLLQASARIQSAISLNFTGAPLLQPAHDSPHPTRIPNQIGTCGTRIWFPHGHYSNPISILLSARKYAQLTARLEKWRRDYQQVRDGAPRIARTPETPAELLFTADVLESPLLFAGCGLHSSEWTLWWLLATKARNEAKHATCPSVYITADEVDAPRAAALRGLNCCVLKVSSHSEVWDRVESLTRCP